MARVVKYEACPKCRSNGRDNRGDNLVRYSDDGGHCFSCGYHERSSTVTSIGNYFGSSVTDKENVRKAILPHDFTREVPADAWKWLLQYGLPYSYWKESVGYSPSESRLVLRVGEPLQFSIGRLIGEPRGENHAKRRKWYVWGDSHKHAEVIGHGDVVVLVEDLISAHKVGQVTTSIPLFGVELHKPHLYYLINDTRPVVIWLDKDQQGAVNKKASWLQSLLNRPVSVVTTDKDPKELDFESIKASCNLY